MNIIGIALIFLGFLIFILNIVFIRSDIPVPIWNLFLIFLFPFSGALLIFIKRYWKQSTNDQVYFSSISGRGWMAYILTLFLTFMYVVIYFGDRITIYGYNLHHVFTVYVYKQFDPISFLVRNRPSDNWFFYATIYTYMIIVFGIRMMIKYQNNRYQILRTISIMFFQFFFAYWIPNILELFKQPGFYFSYFWPLKPEYLYPETWIQYLGYESILPVIFLIISVMISFLLVPVLTYFYGKRWYCSWVCGCGGLANTAGDFFRQHSSKTLISWKIERVMIYSILILIIIITLLLWINSFSSGKILGKYSQLFAEWYGFYIGAIWSGVVGVGFYPLLGTRIWCRFGCPQAAILGIIQRYFSRFRITTNGGQCISCGNCSVYCEMGIDVRWYAQKGMNIVRASCVGCGICSAVCPRGVLKLENGSWKLMESTYQARTNHSYF